MPQVSRPMLAALGAAILFLAVWLVALKPSTPASTGSVPASSGAPAAPSLPGVSGLGRAIAKAHGAVAASDAQSSAAAGASASAPATTPATSPGAPAAHTTAPAPHTAAPQAAAPQAAASAAAQPAQQRHDEVVAALNAHRVLALLFYNPAGADDRGMEQELAAVRAPSGVLKLAIPLAELSRYPMITAQVQVSESPTLVLIDRAATATTLAGFADRFEIAQRLDAIMP